MYCSNCGTELQANQAVCAKCSTRVPFQSGQAASRSAVAAQAESPYADFFVRLAAFVLDNIMLGVVLWVVLPIAMTAATGKYPPWLAVVSTIAYFLYYAIFEASGMQATVGKVVMGLKVTDMQGERISFGRALGHSLARIISQLMFMIGYIVCAFTPRRQTMHDMITGTLVVRKRFEPEQIADAGPAPSGGGMTVAIVIIVAFFGIMFIGILAAIAIPAYQDYTVRAQITEGLNAASPYKLAVARAYADGTEFDAMSSENLKLDSPANLQYVEKIEVLSGAVEITYGKLANRLVAGKTLVLMPGVDANRAVVWLCGLQRVPDGIEPAIEEYAQYTSIQPKYLPATCRPERGLR